MLRIINNYDFKNRSEDETWRDCYEVFAETTPFLSTCGRVCPAVCEQNCNRKDVDGKSVHIRCVERFVGDYALEHGLPVPGVSSEKRPEKIAVVGAGPAGLSCAYQLARKGYSVTVFEAFPKAGGMLRYGIPDYRMPQDVLDREIQRIVDLGVELKTSVRVGTDIDFAEVERDYDAVFVGIGAHQGYALGVAGEDAPNVMSGVAFLNRINAGETIDVGDKVVVIGGGDTAIDAARIARRLGAQAQIVYRRTRTEMPAIEPEIEEALKEGVQIDYLAAPTEILKNGGEQAVGMRCIRMELGEPDASGRRRPVPVEGSEFQVDASFVIPAISQEPDFADLGMLREGRDWIKVDPEFRVALVDGKIYAGGDATNLALVTTAIGQGRAAAEAMDRDFRDREKPALPDKPRVTASQLNKDHWLELKQPAIGEEHISVEEAIAELERETTRTFTVEEARAEAARCMSCGECFDCENCFKYCQDSAVVRPEEKGGEYKFKLENCIGCDKCAESCPCGYIDMRDMSGK
jgi:NADPH-dependent glutamate synthase beta subunit-like oxidoreductase/Pyruvate/2-oxoacid:ferredoxin oxidoreductase delta subunit